MESWEIEAVLLRNAFDLIFGDPPTRVRIADEPEDEEPTE